jgi:PPM family protein phosphatase
VTGGHDPGYAARSDVGRVRTGNEDRYLANPPLFAVADGMGGHQAGEVASTIVVEVLARAGSTPRRDAEGLVRALESANEQIRSRASADPELDGMGTTCTVAIVDGPRVWIAHVGDSRAYLLRSGQLRQLTEDHSLVAMLVRDGIMDADAARVDERRNIITRALGSEDQLRVDVVSLDTEPGDRLLLCSDGLTGLVEDDDVAEALATPDPGAAADRLIALANEAGGDDNITVIVVDPGDVAASAAGDAAAIDGPAAAPRPAPAAARGGGRRRIGIVIVLVVAVALAVAATMFGPLANRVPVSSSPILTAPPGEPSPVSPVGSPPLVVPPAVP